MKRYPVVPLVRYLLWAVRTGARTEVVRQQWLEHGVAIDRTAIIRVGDWSRLAIGSGSTIGAYCVLDVLPDPLGGEAGPAALRIGRRVAVNEFCNLRAGGGEIIVGDNCLLAQYVSVIASNHGMGGATSIRDQPWEVRRQGVSIGDDVWLGAHVVVLPGVTIGSCCVIGAGAVVVEDVPEGRVAVGVPARVVGIRK